MCEERTHIVSFLLMVFQKRVKHSSLQDVQCVLDCFQGYTNADNPFGDEHLLDTFVWSKKLEREGKKHVPMSEIQKMQKTKLIESKVRFAQFIRPTLLRIDLSERTRIEFL